MENKEIVISKSAVLDAHKNADANGKELLEHLFGDTVFAKIDIRERVKTFDDAVEILGVEHPFIKALKNHQNMFDGADGNEDVAAYLKLRIIAAALNEGWQPQFTEDEYRWYPYFYLYTKEQYDRLDEDEKKDCRVVGRAYSSANVSGGVVYASASIAWSGSGPDFGSRLAFKSEELAEYCGKQFIDIWMEYLIG